jgi:hypothetical protein
MHVKSLFLLIALYFGLMMPSMAQIRQPPCTPPAAKPGDPPPPVSLLLATHKCLLQDQQTEPANFDAVQATDDLKHAGIARLIQNPDGLSIGQRVSILNDYAFWMASEGDGYTASQAVKVLDMVVSLAPNRAVAWLNLGDALHPEMDSQSLSYGVYFGGTLSLAATQKASLAQQAVSSYRHYVSLSSNPIARVSAYLDALPILESAKAVGWSTVDAIIKTPEAPRAASVVLGLDEQPAAKLALAMDLDLFLPNPDHIRIKTLLQEAVPQLESATFDGKAASFIPYMQTVAQPAGVGNFPIACGILKTYPDLLQAAEENMGTTRDNFDPVVACNDQNFKLPDSVKRLDDELSGPEGLAYICGSMRFGVFRQMSFYLQLIQYEPEALLPPFTALGDNENPNTPTFAQRETNTLHQMDSGRDGLPLQTWGETDIDSYRQVQKIQADFKQARSDLATYYKSAFGLTPTDAAQASYLAVWLVEDAWQWAAPGTPDRLAAALLAHQPLSEVRAAMDAETSLPPTILFDAVNYPQAMQLLIAEHPDLGVTTQIGKTLLMEAAKYDNPDTVKLLLAQKVSVNTASLAPENVPDSDLGQGFPYPCGGTYDITHGSRTALMYAAANAHLPVIQALLAAGAETSAKDSTGATALDYLEGRGPVPKNSVLNQNDYAAAERLLKP